MFFWQPSFITMRFLWISVLSFFLMADKLNGQAPFSRGVNLSNWFQASSARAIQFSKYSKKDFEQIKSLGCDVIRLPINLQGMAVSTSDLTLDPLFLDLLDQVINWSESLELHLILDNHSFESDITVHSRSESTLSALWVQMARRYKSRSSRVYYEILNEPHDISDAEWGRVQGAVIQAIRAIDSVHTIIVGPANWNSYHHLDGLPVYADSNLLYTFHFYDPFLFTHQGASWTGPSLEPLAGVPFPYQAATMPALPPALKGTWVEGAWNQYPLEGNLAKIKEYLDIALRFREQRNVPVYCGELGVYMPNAAPAERNNWYQQVIAYLNEKQVPWTSWDYHGGFGLFTPDGQDLFDHDLNISLLQAMGLKTPAQSPFEQKPDSMGFLIFMDYVAAGIHESSYGTGLLDFYSRDFPAQGNQVIQWRNPGRYDIIGFDFVPNKDLSVLRKEGYALQFFARCNQSGVQFDARFLDTKTTDPADHPWRIIARLDEKQVPGDNQWHWVSIPLSDFVESGSWDNAWFPPAGKFDWTAIDRFEFVSEYKTLSNTTLSFDQVQIAKPGLTSVATIDVLPFTLFPNPTSDYVHLIPRQTGTFQVQIMDVLGKIHATIAVAGETEIDLTAYPAGFYLLHAFQEGVYLGTVQLMKM